MSRDQLPKANGSPPHLTTSPHHLKSFFQAVSSSLLLELALYGMDWHIESFLPAIFIWWILRLHFVLVCTDSMTNRAYPRPWGKAPLLFLCHPLILLTQSGSICSNVQIEMAKGDTRQVGNRPQCWGSQLVLQQNGRDGGLFIASWGKARIRVLRVSTFLPPVPDIKIQASN